MRLPSSFQLSKEPSLKLTQRKGKGRKGKGRNETLGCDFGPFFDEHRETHSSRPPHFGAVWGRRKWED
jgi:hypothetical protein